MFGIIISSVIAVLAVSVIVLVGVCVYHLIVDPFDMKLAMNELKKTCEASESSIRELTEVVKLMEDCPPIGHNVKPIQVYRCVKLYGFVVGDSQGKARFFAYNRGDNHSEYDVVKFREGNEFFKKKGLKHSIDIKTLRNVLENASKENFKLTLEKNQANEVYKHFKQ